MRICVASGRGARGQNEPGVFYLGSRRLPVRQIIERWRDPSHAYFKVQVNDGRCFVLRCDALAATWELVSVCARPATALSR